MYQIRIRLNKITTMKKNIRGLKKFKLNVSYFGTTIIGIVASFLILFSNVSYSQTAPVLVPVG